MTRLLLALAGLLAGCASLADVRVLSREVARLRAAPRPCAGCACVAGKPFPSYTLPIWHVNELPLATFTPTYGGPAFIRGGYEYPPDWRSYSLTPDGRLIQGGTK